MPSSDDLSVWERENPIRGIYAPSTNAQTEQVQDFCSLVAPQPCQPDVDPPWGPSAAQSAPESQVDQRINGRRVAKEARPGMMTHELGVACWVRFTVSSDLHCLMPDKWMR